MKNVIKYLFLLIVLVVGGWSITHTRQILDQIVLFSYNPPAEIIRLADSDTMSDKTKKVFYVNRPEILDKTTFVNNCPKKEQTIVLGCFVENKGIFLLNVSDDRLSGVVQVTAAHEVLHAMYERLSDKDRKNVDSMTAKFFANLDDQRIKDNIENYRKSDPSVVPNELHSILASEVRNLSPELETYYSQYFTDRKKIVEFSEKYEKTFTDIENQVESIDEQLKSIKADLDAMDANLQNLAQQIETQKAQMDELLKQRKVDEYNSRVPGFNSLVNSYNNIVQNRKQQTINYNKLVETRNNLATVESNLINSLSTDDIKPISGAQ